jgi:hypothetical protein
MVKRPRNNNLTAKITFSSPYVNFEFGFFRVYLHSTNRINYCHDVELKNP